MSLRIWSLMSIYQLTAMCQAQDQASASCFTSPAAWPAVWTYKCHGPSPPLQSHELMQLDIVSCELLTNPACFVGPRSSRDALEL